MNGFDFNPRNVAHAGVRVIPLLLLSFTAVSFVAAADLPKTLGSGGSTSLTASGDWVQAGFDSSHSGFNRFETQLNRGNVGNLTQLWASQVGVGLLYASPVVCNGRVYIGSGDGRMHAFDAATGATLWVGPQQNLFFVDSAAASHGLVFASSLYSTFLAYKADTGEIAWTSELTDVRAPPTLHGRTLYVGSFDGTLSALDAQTGTTKWSAEAGCCIFDQAPVVDDGRVLQMRTDHTLTAYDAQTGEQLWSKPEFSVGTQAAAYRMVFFNHYPNIVALDTATGDEVWTAPLVTGATTGAPALANRRVFITQSTLMALDAATGAVVWEAPAASTWGPSVANGVVYASSLNGEWDAFDERNGTLLWSVTPSSGCGGTCANSTPVIANGTLYLAGPDNYLRAYGLPR
ncbi:MAG TPA: PQQ-binding-like beta-propeller repeat protein [Chthoniobacterales bacterium]